MFFIAALFSLVESLARKGIIEKEFGRKLLHLISALVAAYSPNLVNDKIILIITGAGISVATLLLLKGNFLPAVDSRERKSWGIFFFTAAYTFLVSVLPTKKLWIMQLAFIILGFSDSLAAIVGTYFGKNYFHLTRDKKSIAGSVTFFFTAFILFFILSQREITDYFFINSFRQNDFLQIVIFGIYISLILSVVEAISSGGSDNFFIAIFAAPLLFLFLANEIFFEPKFIYLSIPLSLAMALVSYRLRFLTTDGAAALIVLALLLFGLGGFKWTIPILFFFISASSIAKLKRASKENIGEIIIEKSEARNYLQVISNGGIGALFVILNLITQNELWYYAFVIIVAGACADTWATEIGTRFGKKTISIISFQKIETGLSGGVSAIGTLAAFAGSLSVGLISYYYIDDLKIIFVVILFGFLGSVIDSLLGATVQAKYECQNCKSILEKNEHCSANAALIKGFRRINNNSVNFLSGLFSSIIFLVLTLSK